MAADILRHVTSIARAHNAYTAIAAQQPLQQAAARRVAGPLSGQWVAVKDNISTLDLPTTCASATLDGYQAPLDATVVRQLRLAGAVVVGKTNMDEFGMGSHSTSSSRGPVVGFDRASAGGSSGGSAMAVAVDEPSGVQVDLAIGTDTGGSLRLPAAYTTTYALKPSYGLVSRWGVVAYANSLDTVGFLASRRAGIPLLRNALLATNTHDPQDPTSLAPATRTRLARLLQGRKPRKTKRFGVPRESIIALHPAVRAAWSATLHALQDAGHTIHAVSIPPWQQALAAYYILAPAEASSNLAKYDGVRYGPDLSPSQSPPADASAPSSALFTPHRAHLQSTTQARILLGAYSLSSSRIDNYFVAAQRVRRLVKDAFDSVFALPNILTSPVEARLTEIAEREGMDALILPTAAAPPPTLDEVAQQTDVERMRTDVFTVPASLAGLPVVNVPVQKGVGVQVVGQFGDDAGVLEVGEVVAGLVGVRALSA